jgi:hypothetical protein
MHLLEVTLNFTNKDDSINMYVLDLYDWFDIAQTLPTTAPAANDIVDTNALEFCNYMFFEIYESSMTKCANEGSTCSITTCPAGFNFYYGVDDGSGNLDREANYYKKYITTSDYLAGTTFSCADASFDNVDPESDATKSCWCSNEAYIENKVNITDYDN